MGCPTRKGSYILCVVPGTPIHRADALEWGLRQIGPLRGPFMGGTLAEVVDGGALATFEYNYL